MSCLPDTLNIRLHVLSEHIRSVLVPAKAAAAHHAGDQFPRPPSPGLLLPEKRYHGLGARLGLPFLRR